MKKTMEGFGIFFIGVRNIIQTAKTNNKPNQHKEINDDIECVRLFRV